MNKLVKNALVAFSAAMISTGSVLANDTDTLILKFGNNSSIIVKLNDKKDLELIRKYDINEMLRQLQVQVDSSDNTNFLIAEGEKGIQVLKDTTFYYTPDEEADSDNPWNRSWVWNDNKAKSNYNSSNNDFNVKFNKKKNRRTDNDLRFDLGINNWLENDRLPDETGAAYSLQPWGSWNFAINSIHTTRIAKPLYLDWGLGVNWMTFRFNDPNVRVQKIEATQEIDFFRQINPNISSMRSRMTVPYLNAHFVPKFKFGRGSDGFRIGVGGYGGYRIGGNTKITYRENGDKQKSKVRDSYYLNSWRYGARVELGWGDFDMFITYDLNTVFATTATAPKLNAFTVGFTF